MKKDTFHTLRRMVEDDPLTEAQIKILTGESTRTLVGAHAAAEILGVSVITVRRLPLPRVRTNSRRVQFRLSDIYRFMDERSSSQ
jgi:adenine/guanine phosphoribosyltransferase-like PRPP-binding protein